MTSLLELNTLLDLLSLVSVPIEASRFLFAPEEMAKPDFDPSEFLFGPEPEADPALVPKSAAPLYQEIIARPSAASSVEPDSVDALPHEATQATDSNHDDGFAKAVRKFILESRAA